MSFVRTHAIGTLIKMTLAAATLAAAQITTAQASAKAPVVARIDISEQRMDVFVHGRKAYRWKVSTGARGYVTPTGRFKPYRMHRMWYSRKYDNTPMPHSIFFHGGYAVHATKAIRQLGRPASHGCIRLHPKNAKRFFELVRRVGKSNANIVITR